MAHIAAGGSGEAMQDADVQLVSQEVTSLSLPQLPLPLLAAVKCFHSALVLLQLSDPRGDSLSSRLHLPLRVSRPFTGTPVYALSLTKDEQLRAACGGNTAKLVRLLAEGTCRFVEPDRNAFKKLMRIMLRRVAGRLAAAARERVFDEGLRLQAAGQHAAAAAQLQYAVALGHLPARAALAWLLRHGRQRVPAQCSRAEQPPRQQRLLLMQSQMKAYPAASPPPAPASTSLVMSEIKFNFHVFYHCTITAP